MYSARAIQLSHTLLSLWEYKESTCNTEDSGSIPGSGRSPGERNDNPLQYSCLENSMNREDWWAIVHGITKSQTQLSNQTTTMNTTTIDEQKAKATSCSLTNSAGRSMLSSMISAHRRGEQGHSPYFTNMLCHMDMMRGNMIAS